MSDRKSYKAWRRKFAQAYDESTRAKYLLLCFRCAKQFTTGLGGGPAVTDSDLMLAAKVNGWDLSARSAYCPECVVERRGKDEDK